MQVLATFRRYRFQAPFHLYFSLVAVLAVVSFVSGCHSSEQKGLLRVNAPGKGQYEIYRIANERPFQLFSEEVGHFNRDISLTTGSYLILADCSSQMVVITPNRKKEITAHQIQFNTPVKSRKDDRFVIQCNRSRYTQDRQMIVNRFKLNVFHGSTELLIGMAPLNIEFEDKDGLTPQTKKFDLSAVQVSNVDNENESSRFFVSPAAEVLSVTESQSLGNWLYLMPGAYKVELNGSITSVDLTADNMIKIDPAFLTVETSDEVDLGDSSAIKGDPLHYEINGGHWLYLNQTYAVLPGRVSLRLIGTGRDEILELESGDKKVLAARSVRVDLECPPWNWNCLGSKKVFLYNKDQHYPFAEGVTNVPLLFFGKDAWVTLEGSTGLRYLISDERRDKILKAGILQLTPVEEHRPGAITDLVRIESTGHPVEGHTLDVSLDDTTNMPLIRGSYNLAHYTSYSAGDGDRRRQTRRVFAEFGKETPVSFKVYVSEKKWDANISAIDQRILNRRSSIARRMSQKSLQSRPARIQ